MLLDHILFLKKILKFSYNNSNIILELIFLALSDNYILLNLLAKFLIILNSSL